MNEIDYYEIAADLLLEENNLLYKRGGNGELYTEKQLDSKRKYERPFTDIGKERLSRIISRNVQLDSYNHETEDEIIRRWACNDTEITLIKTLNLGLNQQETASILGWSQSKVSRTLNKIRKKIKNTALPIIVRG